MIGYIYKTTNLKNNKIYIGQHLAESFEPSKYIGSGALFKKIVARDGFDNFICEMLCACDTVEDLNKWEKYYIKLFNSQDRSIGYNIADGGEEPWNRGKKMSVQYCKKGSEAQRNNAPSICCYSLESGELLTIFNSAYDAAEFLKLDTPSKTVASRIRCVCMTGHGHAYGYIWRNAKDYNKCKKLLDDELNREHKNPRSKLIEQYSLDGILIATYDSAATYSKAISADSKEQRRIARGINGCCIGDSKTYRGFIWKYKQKD